MGFLLFLRYSGVESAEQALHWTGIPLRSQSPGYPVEVDHADVALAKAIAIALAGTLARARRGTMALQ